MPRRYLAWIAGVALALRLLNAFQILSAPDTLIPIIDAADYDDHARRLVETGRFHPFFFWQAPFYPFVLAIVYLVSGSSIKAALFAQALVGAATAVATGVLGARIAAHPGGGRSQRGLKERDAQRVGLAAGLIVAAYGPLLFYESHLLATGWAALWMPLLVLSLMNLASAARARDAFLAGIVAAAATLTRPTFLAAALLAWLFLLVSGERRRSIRAPRPVAAALAGFTLLVAPVMVTNGVVNGHFGFLPASGGVNLYIGSNPESDATLALRPGSEWNEMVERPEEIAGREGIYAQSRWFYGQALRYAREHPADFLAGTGRKLLKHLSSREIPRSYDIYPYRTFSLPLRALVWHAGRFGFPFGVLFPLAVVGLVAARRTIPAPIPIILVAYSLPIVLIFAASRYRAPLIPLFAVAAALGGFHLWRLMKERRTRVLSVYALAAVLVAVAVSAPGPFAEEQFDYRAEIRFLVGNRLWSRDPAASVGYYEEAVRLNPGEARYHANLGEAYAAAGRHAEALEQYNQAITRGERTAIVLNLRGVSRMQLHRLGEAVEDFTRALEMDPEFVAAWSNRAAALIQAGRPDQATPDLEKAIALEPNEAALHLNLASVLLRLGDVDGARRHLTEVIRLAPRTHLAEQAREVLEGEAAAR